MGIIETFETMLGQGKENSMIRYSLGNAYFTKQDYELAVEHFRRAVELDPNYSAAWKMLGRALEKSNHKEEALTIFEKGIEIAETKGDMQAVKEMKVYLKRLQKN